MQIGNRVIHDQDGNIILQMGEMEGDVLARKAITELKYIDLPYGAIDYSRHRIISIDVSTRHPVLEKIPITLKTEQ